MKNYTVKLPLEQIEFLRSQRGSASALIRSLIETEINRRKALTESPSQKIIRLNKEIAQIDQEISRLESALQPQAFRDLERKVASLSMVTMRLQAACEAGDEQWRTSEDTFVTVAQGYPPFMEFLKRKLGRLPNREEAKEFLDPLIKEKQALKDQLTKAKQVFEAYSAEIKKLQEKKVALEKELLACQM